MVLPCVWLRFTKPVKGHLVRLSSIDGPSLIQCVGDGHIEALTLDTNR